MSNATRERLSASLRLAWQRRKRKPAPEHIVPRVMDQRTMAERALDQMSRHHDNALIHDTYVGVPNSSRRTFSAGRHGILLSSPQDAV